MGGISHLNHCQDLLPLVHVIFSFSFTGIIIHSRSSSLGCGKLLLAEQKAAPETADAAFPNAQIQLREKPKWHSAGPESKAVPESGNHCLPKPEMSRRKGHAQWYRALDDEAFQTDRQRLRKIPQPRAMGWSAMLKKEPPEKVAKGDWEFVIRQNCTLSMEGYSK